MAMRRPTIRMFNLAAYTPDSGQEIMSEASEDEIFIKLLGEKTKLAEVEIDKEFGKFQKKKERKSKLDLEIKQQTKLKTKLNKVSAANLRKEAKLKELKDSLSRMAQLSERSQMDYDEPIRNQLEDLEMKCLNAEAKLEDERNQSKILKNMLSRTRITAVRTYSDDHLSKSKRNRTHS